jgi:FkbM family methyltransferase
VIYGAGGFARALVDILRAAGARVAHALDRRGHAAALPALEVYHPDDDPLGRSERSTMVAVVGVFNRDADPAAIERSLRSLGYGRVVGVPELYESFADELGERFWLARRGQYEEHSGRIQAAADVWSDAPSRELYRSLLRYRVDWSATEAPRPCNGLQYFPDDVPRTTSPMRLIDCGAFDGDTLRAIAALGVPVEDAFAFEPDPGNFARLVETSAEFARATGAQVALWPCAVTDRTASRRFRSGVGEAGHIAADGDESVTSVALDDVLPVVLATDLKMDIEGAELDALRGAERLIRRARPRLAICVYHRPEHLWEIPLAVRDLGVPYEYFLRSHGHAGFDAVMYAVPRE